jgi:hypothetical protein
MYTPVPAEAVVYSLARERWKTALFCVGMIIFESTPDLKGICVDIIATPEIKCKHALVNMRAL